MTTRNKKIALIIGAGLVLVISIVGALEIARTAPLVVVGLLACGGLILLALRIRANRKAKVIFGFYVATKEILIDG